ncbi:hypothetical protein Aperf_G00000117659 [Anoplocephala perfoliata]
MWRFCCVISRKESKIIEIQRHSKTSVDLLPAVSTEPASSLASLCCDDYRRNSWNKSNGHTDNPTRRHSTPYFEVDLETGRRPTLVIESTARLAVAESVDLEHSRRSSSISSQAIYKPLSGMSTRRKVVPGSPVEVNPITVEATEDSASTRRPPNGRKKGGFIKLRSSGSSFRKRMLLRKSERGMGFPRLNFMSKGRTQPKEELGDSQMQRTPLQSMDTSVKSRRDSLYIFSHADEPIVTPFAQILVSLRKVRTNFISLTNVQSTKDLRFGTSHSEDPRRIPGTAEDESQSGLAMETLEELEWCLERLESIQTHRSVSDMASSKFKKMLNKELSLVYDGDKANSQISDYISTFLERDEQTSDGQMPCGSGGSGDNDDNEPAAGMLSPSACTSTAKSAVTDQKSMTGKNAVQNQQVAISPKSSVIVRLDKNTAKKLAAVTAEKRPGETSLNPKCTNRSGLQSVSPSSPNLPSILGPNVSGLGVDPKRVAQFQDPPEPPPTYGIIPDQPEEFTELIENELDQWGMDVFKLAECTSSPLTCVTYTILKRRGLINKFKIPHWNLLRYLKSVEDHYNIQTPYHNKVHAVDVVQSVHVLLQAPALDSVFTDLEMAAVIIACAVHDVNHPAVTNQYLINTNDALAILYNDSSVLENYHLAVAFNLLTFPGCDILVNLSKKQRASFRRMVIDMVLSTDMSKHMTLLADLKTMVETKKVAGSGILNLDNYTDRLQILQNMVHCADLSNTAKPLHLYTKWVYLLMEEFFLQGDRERAAGLDISPMCDRETATVEKSQVSFIDFISHPLWEAWCDLVHPAAQSILELLEYNRSWYFNLIHADDHQQQQKEPEEMNKSASEAS